MVQLPRAFGITFSGKHTQATHHVVNCCRQHERTVALNSVKFVAALAAAPSLPAPRQHGLAEAVIQATFLAFVQRGEQVARASSRCPAACPTSSGTASGGCRVLPAGSSPWADCAIHLPVDGTVFILSSAAGSSHGHLGLRLVSSHGA